MGLQDQKTNKGIARNKRDSASCTDPGLDSQRDWYAMMDSHH